MNPHESAQRGLDRLGSRRAGAPGARRPREALVAERLEVLAEVARERRRESAEIRQLSEDARRWRRGYREARQEREARLDRLASLREALAGADRARVLFGRSEQNVVPWAAALCVATVLLGLGGCDRPAAESRDSAGSGGSSMGLVADGRPSSAVQPPSAAPHPLSRLFVTDEPALLGRHASLRLGETPAAEAAHLFDSPLREQMPPEYPGTFFYEPWRFHSLPPPYEGAIDLITNVMVGLPPEHAVELVTAAWGPPHYVHSPQLAGHGLR
jgi:hypothetical protein